MEPIFIIMALVDIKKLKSNIFNTPLQIFAVAIFHGNLPWEFATNCGKLRWLFEKAIFGENLPGKFSVRIYCENLTLLFLDKFSFLIIENSFFSETFFGTWCRLRATVVSSFQRNFSILHVGLLKQLMITILSNQMKDFCF